MHEAGLLLALRPVAGLHTPGLEVAAHRTGRNLAIRVLARQPDLDIVGLSGPEPHVARTQHHRAVRQVEAFKHLFRAARHALVFIERGRFVGDRDQLDLVELVLAQHAARVLAGRAGLGAEAGRQRGEAQRQGLGVEDFLAHQIGERDLGCRD